MMKQHIAKHIIASRMFILVAMGAALYYLIAAQHLSLWYILAAGVLTGVLFGKVFCRWLCPMGIIMELMMSFSGNKNAALLQYHKLGCPIAWVSGWFNKYSLFSISRNRKICTDCGLCDKSCYIATIEPENYSLHKPTPADAADSYTCSRCLKCVAECPNGSLSFGLRKKQK